MSLMAYIVESSTSLLRMGMWWGSGLDIYRWGRKDWEEEVGLAGICVGRNGGDDGSGKLVDIKS